MLRVTINQSLNAPSKCLMTLLSCGTCQNFTGVVSVSRPKLQSPVFVGDMKVVDFCFIKFLWNLFKQFYFHMTTTQIPFTHIHASPVQFLTEEIHLNHLK